MHAATSTTEDTSMNVKLHPSTHSTTSGWMCEGTTYIVVYIVCMLVWWSIIYAWHLCWEEGVTSIGNATEGMSFLGLVGLSLCSSMNNLCSNWIKFFCFFSLPTDQCATTTNNKKKSRDLCYIGYLVCKCISEKNSFPPQHSLWNV